MQSGSPDTPKGQPAIGEAALFGLCPNCGARTLFSGLTSFAPRCRACGLDLGQFNVGDGPAAFLILIVGAVVVGLAAWLQVSVEPPWWVHVLLWLPISIALTLGGLRMAKAALLVSENRNKAREAGSNDL
ncbi:DUF983 domain-containing protein [Parerythrobacter jejuensis]|uniref:DUF983 domain-containing protein n=1 Tax=Parerythrobacter jejuensis TaxID=795812 RepID=A0A845ASA4_9SPHN|nr:DUF983 domain-containing protein [Parerythrobacter jejuensis]MXP31835.1 DUF983 domain-containing protein [Parerythrobacter jejuensis]